ncbi:MAG: glycosyltransferase family 2 protein [Spirochaetia bacterium]|jgi:glycosyltransferase involved in cell wall biosynthesis|nr:glycosyltransferase family 2 protein [Spirochaetia bacterium]
MKSLISVIIPVYNVEPYIRKCVDSVILQTYSRLEIILVDDGSPDTCGEICDDYALKDSRVRVIHKENGGLSDARNSGLDAAGGEYVLFLDSDDSLAPDCILKLFELLTAHNADIAICNYYAVKKGFSTLQSGRQGLHSFSGTEAIDELFGSLRAQFTVSWCKLFKAELFRKLRFPKGKIHEDNFTSYRLYHASKKVVYTDEPLLYHLKRPDSIIGSSFKLKNHLDKIQATEEMIAFLKEQNLKKLEYKAWRMLFYHYFLLRQHTDSFNDKASLTDFKKNLKLLQNELRKTKQKAGFTIFYHLYFMFPSMMTTVFLRYRKIKMKLLNRHIY